MLHPEPSAPRQEPAPAENPPEAELERRVLILAPYGNDARLTASMLRGAGLATATCADAGHLCRESAHGCGAWLLSEEALDQRSLETLKACLEAQPSWSDVPVVLVTSSGELSYAQGRHLAAIRAMGNVTLLERPFRAGTLISTLEMALRSRQRQYQVRGLLEQTARDAETLRQASRRKDEFLAMLAHELRNPLSSVTHAAALQRETSDDADRSWAAEVITRQTAQLSRLVDDLLDVSRITQGKIKLVLGVVDSAQILTSACQTVAPLVASRGHTLHTDYQEGTCWLRADATRVEQIVVNLLTNAAKYSYSNGHIWLTARCDDRVVTITVRDSGVGIPPDRIQDMFEMFTQGDRTAARSEGGLGIGLPVVKTLCEMHGGSVVAESPGLGKGSTFTVTLPAAAVPSSTPAAPVGKTEGVEQGQGARLLLVDDNLDSAHGLERLLRRRGFRVEVAHDGPQALKLAAPSPPEVVLLDIGLPGMDGYEVARRLRTDAGCVNTFLVALTGYGQEDDRARARASGFDAHFVKPVDFKALLHLLQEKTAGS